MCRLPIAGGRHFFLYLANRNFLYLSSAFNIASVGTKCIGDYSMFYYTVYVDL